MVVFFLAGSGFARAQSGAAGCPPGMVPGPGRCYGPNELPQQQQSTPAYTGPLWQDHYGAIASSISGAHSGIAENMLSARAARRKALHDCGASDCKIDREVRNGCIAAAWGGGVSGNAGNKEIASAEASAIKECESGGGHDCKLTYSACSLPVRVQ
ncbi:MAG: DUF4189 domain-containing protein [Bacteroidetes bacterium]|nr:DUF4189 domain-containing protein [Bacteroidota bacterium]